MADLWRQAGTIEVAVVQRAERARRATWWIITLFIACWVLTHVVRATIQDGSFADLIAPDDWSTFTTAWCAVFIIVVVAEVTTVGCLWQTRRLDFAIRLLTALNFLAMSLVVVPFAFLPEQIEYQSVAPVALVLIAGSVSFATGIRLLPLRLAFNRSAAGSDRHAWLVPILAAALFAVYFSWLAISRCRAMIPDVFDMSWENQALWSTYRVWPMWATVWGDSPYFRYHTPYIYYVIGIFYHVHPCPETAVVIQAMILSLGGPFLYLLLRALGISTLPSAIISLAYLLHPCLHGMALFDLHSGPLGIPFVFLTLYGLVRGRPVIMVLGMILALSSREEVALLVAAAGLYGCLTKIHPRLATVLVLAGAGFFLLNTKVIMPHFGASGAMGGNVARFSELLGPDYADAPLSRLFMVLVCRPARILNTLMTWPRIEYLILMSLPVGGLCWIGGWRSWALLAPGLFITLMSHRHRHYEIGYQYSAMLLPAILVTAGLGCKRLEGLLSGKHIQRSVLIAMVFLVVSTTHLYGSLLSKTYKLQFVGRRPSEQLESPIRYGTSTWCSPAWPGLAPEYGPMRYLRRTIPSSASLRVEDPRFHAMLSSRKEILSLRTTPWYRTDFVLLCGANPEIWAPVPEYVPIWTSDGQTLYQKVIRPTAAGRYTCATSRTQRGILDGYRPMVQVALIPNPTFEAGTLEGWQATGRAFQNQPVKGDTAALRGKPASPEGTYWIGTYEYFGDHVGGRCVSAEFAMNADIIGFLLGGGSSEDPQEVQIIDAHNGAVLRAARPQLHREAMIREYIDVRSIRGRRCRICILDTPSKGYSHINVDDFIGLLVPDGAGDLLDAATKVSIRPSAQVQRRRAKD